MREVYRGRFQPEKGHQECVKRRAALSLSMSGACKVIKFNTITIIIYHYHRHYYCYIILNTSWCSFFPLVNSFTIWILLLSFTLWSPFCVHAIEIHSIGYCRSLSAVFLYCFLFSITFTFLVIIFLNYVLQYFGFFRIFVLKMLSLLSKIVITTLLPFMNIIRLRITLQYERSDLWLKLINKLSNIEKMFFLIFIPIICLQSSNIFSTEIAMRNSFRWRNCDLLFWLYYKIHYWRKNLSADLSNKVNKKGSLCTYLISLTWRDILLD